MLQTIQFAILVGFKINLISRGVDVFNTMVNKTMIIIMQDSIFMPINVFKLITQGENL